MNEFIMITIKTFMCDLLNTLTFEFLTFVHTDL